MNRKTQSDYGKGKTREKIILEVYTVNTIKDT